MGGRSRLATAIAAVLSLAAAGIVAAADPRDGELFQGGYDPPQKSGEFKAKVRFRTSDDGTRVRRAKFDFRQCGGLGGPIVGNPYHRIRFRAMDIDDDGRFSCKRVKRNDEGNPFTGTYTVKGRFTKSNRARGTAKMKIRYEDPQFPDCESAKLHWKAKIK